MKSRVVARVLAGVATATMVLGTVGTAQAWEAPYVEEGIQRAVAAARKLKDLSGFACRSDGVCLVGGFVENDHELTWTASLKAGKEYIFVGAGDTDVKDLDIGIFEGDKLVVKDDDEDNTPVVAVTAHDDANATIKMHVAKAPGGGEKHFCVLIMLENGGTGAKLSQLEECAKQLNAACKQAQKSAELQFDQAPNTVCLVAGLIEKGESKTFDRSFSKGTPYLMVGAGDANCVDLDLEVSHEGQVVAKDEDTDATPVAAITVGEENVRCKVKMTMHDASKPSFAVVAILTTK